MNMHSFRRSKLGIDQQLALLLRFSQPIVLAGRLSIYRIHEAFSAPHRSHHGVGILPIPERIDGFREGVDAVLEYGDRNQTRGSQSSDVEEYVEPLQESLGGKEGEHS